MINITCPQCKEVRQLTEKPRSRASGVCRKCADENRTQKYVRICTDCGDEKVCTSKTQADSKRCRVCATKLNAIKRTKRVKKPKVTYEVECPECLLTRTITTSPRVRKSDMCADCSRKLSKKKRDLEGNIIRHFRVCKVCGNAKEVKSAKNAEVQYCKKHTPRPTGAKRKQVATYKPRTKSGKAIVSQQAIEKVRQINKQHKAIQDEIKKKPIPRAKLSNEDMVKAYLVNNTVTMLSSDEPKQLGYTMHNSGNR